MFVFIIYSLYTNIQSVYINIDNVPMYGMVDIHPCMFKYNKLHCYIYLVLWYHKHAINHELLTGNQNNLQNLSRRWSNLMMQ